MPERTTLEQVTRRVLELLDAMDLDTIAEMATDDVQGVDELTHGWLRGRDVLDEYLAQLKDTVSDVRSKISDLHTIEVGDVGLVTYVLEQTYVMDGEQQTVSAPTSMVFRREDGSWKIALIHSGPM